MSPASPARRRRDARARSRGRPKCCQRRCGRRSSVEYLARAASGLAISAIREPCYCAYARDRRASFANAGCVAAGASRRKGPGAGARGPGGAKCDSDEPRKGRSVANALCGCAAVRRSIDRPRGVRGTVFENRVLRIGAARVPRERTIYSHPITSGGGSVVFYNPGCVKTGAPGSVGKLSRLRGGRGLFATFSRSAWPTSATIWHVSTRAIPNQEV